MRWFGAQLRQHLCRRDAVGNARPRRFSSATGGDELSLEEEADRKFGHLLKIIFAGTAGYVAWQFFPYMGDSLLQQSVSLLHVKDPLFKRMGASRLTKFAVDDERRLKIVEIGGAQKLIDMLGAAKDDRTRRAALKALLTLSQSEEVAGFLHQAGVVPIVKCTPRSSEYPEVENYKSDILKRFQDLKYDIDHQDTN